MSTDIFNLQFFSVPVLPSIIFIDSSLGDVSALIVSLPPGVDVHLLKADGDGLQFIADKLAGVSGIAAIHLLSHGTSGQVHLGALNLSRTNLNDYADTLAQIAASLTDEGDFLIYGCNAVPGETGHVLVNSLARLTQAEVTGLYELNNQTNQGGNWVLDTCSGLIHAPVFFIAPYDDSGGKCGFQSKNTAQSNTSRNSTSKAPARP